MNAPEMIACDVYWLDDGAYTGDAAGLALRAQIEHRLPRLRKVQQAARVGRLVFCITYVFPSFLSLF